MVVLPSFRLPWFLLGAAIVAGCTRRDPPGAAPAASSSGLVSTTPLSPEEEAKEDTASLLGGRGGSGVTTADVPTGPDYDVAVGGEDKLGAKSTHTWIYEGPNDETPKLGYLRAGALVDRGKLPVAMTKRCPQGWYRVAPEGFVCAGNRATLDGNDPVLVASWKPPQRGEPLPYRYGRSREVPPNLYVKVPSKKEQSRSEGARYHDATPPPPALLSILGTVEALPPFLADGHVLPKPFGATQRVHNGVHEGKSNVRSAFALLSVHDVEGRLFGLTTDLNLVPIDKLTIAKVTPIHGGTVADLPAAWVTVPTARLKADDQGKLRTEGQWERYEMLSLTGTTKGELWETTTGEWVAETHLRLLKKREEWPSFAKTGGKKWIDVSIHQQTLIAYEGQRAVYATFVSTGAGEMADPETTSATKRGAFTIKAKHVTAKMTGAQSDDDYELADVPYVQYFEAGYALHGAFWHEDFGRVRSHGCINLPPRDAAWLFEWTEPSVPASWHGVQAGGEGTVVYVHY